VSAPNISVVIPTLNSAWCLGETLQSILGQHKSVARVIVVDSESTDDTRKLCGQFGIEVLSEPPGNMYRAINAGLRRCDTEWVAYTNADDPWYGDAHRRLLAEGQARGADLIYGAWDCIDAHGRFLYSFAPPAPHQLGAFFRMAWMPFSQTTVVFRRALFERLGGFDERYTLCADFDFFLRAHVVGARFARVGGRPVSRWRLHDSQLSNRHAQTAEAQKRESSARAGLSATAADRWRIFSWRLSNWPNYLERIVRGAQLRGAVSIPRALES
jgi:glycosyltransferase involved in cell wall biosynthesis